MENDIESRKILSELFASQRLAVLAADDGGKPYTTLVAFAGTEDLKHLIFATLRQTRKFTCITRNPHVSLLIDSRSNQVEDFSNAVAVTAMGRAGESKGDKKEYVIKRYLAKHPHLNPFTADPSCALMDVSVDTYYIVRQFQEVTEWEPGDER